MKNIKSILALLLALTIVLLAGCGSQAREIEYNTPVSLKYTSETADLQYGGVYWTADFGYTKDDLPEANPEYTQLFNTIVCEEDAFFHEEYPDLPSLSEENVPVIILDDAGYSKFLGRDNAEENGTQGDYNCFYDCVFLHEGYVSNANPDEVLGVLGHEGGHYIFRDYNDLEISTFAIQKKNNTGIGYYFSEAMNQKLTNDFLKENYPDAYKTRYDNYMAAPYIADTLCLSMPNAAYYYLTNNIAAFDDEFSELVWKNTDSYTVKDKYTPFEHLLYYTDMATHWLYYARDDEDALFAMENECAAWELVFCTARDTDQAIKESMKKKYELCDTRLTDGIFIQAGLSNYLYSVANGPTK